MHIALYPPPEERRLMLDLAAVRFATAILARPVLRGPSPDALERLLAADAGNARLPEPSEIERATLARPVLHEPSPAAGAVAQLPWAETEFNFWGFLGGKMVLAQRSGNMILEKGAT